METIQEPSQVENSQHMEPSDVKEKLERGEFAVSYFHGQTFLFIPKSIGVALGMQRLQALAEQIFGKEVLEKFSGSTSDNYFLSYFVELPPQSDWDNNDVTKFIQAIKDESHE
jgi:hypothetical protein